MTDEKYNLMSKFVFDRQKPPTLYSDVIIENIEKFVTLDDLSFLLQW